MWVVNKNFIGTRYRKESQFPNNQPDSYATLIVLGLYIATGRRWADESCHFNFGSHSFSLGLIKSSCSDQAFSLEIQRKNSFFWGMHLRTPFKWIEQ